MKNLVTSNLIKFTLVAFLLTIIFRIGLSTSITNKIIIGAIMSALIYAVLMWLNGSYFGKKEYDYLPIYDVGFRFHVSTFFAHNIISILWFKLGFESKYENISITYNIAIIWSIFLITHLIYYISVRKSNIKNIHKEDLFE